LNSKTKILIIDDSELVRQSLKEVFSQDENLHVIGMANDPYEAVRKLKVEVPDVITLDIEMPKMDGITFLRKLMKQHPIPVVVISTLTKKGTNEALKALQYGAVDVMHKPQITTGDELNKNAVYLRNVVKSASKANVRKLHITNFPQEIKRFDKKTVNVPIHPSKKIIAIGASTGGTEAIKKALSQLDKSSPGVVIVQHMPKLFTKQFADRLDMECDIHVKEANHGDLLKAGQALIAPGNMHMMLKRSAIGYYVEVKDGPLVNRHMPSVDVLFKSVARYGASNAIGILLTGMGKDGAKGLKEMKDAGAMTIAQDEVSSVVFGMPKEAINLNAAKKVLNLEQVADLISHYSED